MKLNILIFLLLGFMVNVSGQNLLGSNQKKIKKYIRKNDTDMAEVSGLTNGHFNYLKFESGDGTRTVMFFMTDDDHCKSVKQIYILSMKDEIVSGLDKLYKKINDGIWIDNRVGRKAVISLETQEWYFTVSIKPQKKKKGGSSRSS